MKNPKPGVAGADGAASGPLTQEAGDTLYFNRHVDTTAERAAELGGALPTQTLYTANEAFTGETCIVNGHTVGGTLGFGL